MGTPVLDIPNFRLLDPIGKGGAGAVYLAEQLRPHRKVAIKIISPDSLPADFMNVLKEEGDVVAQFEHDNLVTVHECGIVDDHYYLVEQYLGGGDLTGRVAQGVSPAEAVSIIRSIASALGHIHERGYVHRDVKPGNILFTESGKPVLADFGLAKAADTVGVLTQAGYTSGTPAYMSPEQIQGGTLDGRSDLYSLGIVLYELLTGQRPFFADSDFELRKAQVEQTAPRLPAGLSQFQPILDRLLAKVPGARYVVARDLIQALDQLKGVSEEVTQLTSPPQGPRSPAAPKTDFASVTTWVREMSRRRVFRVMALYLVTSWGITEALTTVSEYLHLPDWTRTGVVVLFIVGFPVAMALAWLFDIGPDGVRRTRPGSRKGMLTIFLSVTVLLSATALVVNLLDEAVVEETSQSETVQSPSIAVLAFANMSADPDNEYFADGLSEEIIHVLARIDGLKVAGRTSSFHYKGSNPDLREVGETLGVAHVLEGSVRQQGETVRVTAQLIRAADGFHIWSDSFDFRLNDAFVIQDRVSREVASALRKSLFGEEPTSKLAIPDRNTPRMDGTTYQTYLHAVARFGRRTREDNEMAIDLLERVTKEAPEFANGWAVLGTAMLTHSWSYAAGPPWPDAKVIIASALENAIALQPESAVVQAAWGQYNTQLLIVGGKAAKEMADHKELADQAFQRALTIDPDYPEALYWYASFLGSQGNNERAMEYLDRALAIDPLRIVAVERRIWTLIGLGRIDEARAAAFDALLVFPDQSMPYLALAAMEENRGRLDRAWLWLDRAKAGYWVAWARYHIALATGVDSLIREASAEVVEFIPVFSKFFDGWDQYHRGDLDGARQSLEEFIRLYWQAECSLARVPAWLGEWESALEGFEHCSNEPLSADVGRDAVDEAGWLSTALLKGGHTDRARDIARSLLEATERVGTAKPGSFLRTLQINRVVALSILGEEERAINSLDRYRKEGLRSLTVGQGTDFHSDQRFEALRRNPRFLSLIDEIRSENARMVQAAINGEVTLDDSVELNDGL